MGKSKTPTAPTVTAGQAAGETQAAHSAYDPQAAQLNYNIQSNQDYGTPAMTALYQSLFNQYNPQAAGLKNDLYSNLINSLSNPSGITDQQQQAVQNIRDRATQDLTRSLNTQANLGGGLYGGVNYDRVGRQVGNLQDQFANEDIQYQQQNQQNAIQNILRLMGINPEPGIVANQFQSPVADPTTVYQGNINQNQFAAQQQAAANASRQAMLGSLFQGLGTAAGMALGGPIGAGIGSKIGGSVAPSTGLSAGYSQYLGK